MKTKTILLPIAITLTVALNFMSTMAKAAHRDDLSGYAHQIDSIAHELRQEFSIHYKHSQGYRHLMSDVADLINTAHHIDRLTHDVHSSLRHISTDLKAIDRTAHHLHNLVESSNLRWHRGHTHGNTRHVHRLLRTLNDTIHAMQATADQMRHHYSDRPLHHREYQRAQGSVDPAIAILGFILSQL